MSINAQANSIDQLFSSNVHYRVPHYQRRYVWDTTNWDRLWKDILFQLEGVEGEERPTHFTGPIVTRSIGKKAYEVIDGQQRLATFQIILCVIRDICKTQDDSQKDKLAKSAAKYIINDEDVLIDDPDYEFTFIPTKHDQPAFSQVTSKEYFTEYLQNGANSDSDKHSILKAYDHFADLIQEHVGENLNFEKMRRLLRSITDNFMLVNLELGSEDERPEQVFASINATGRKLSEFDYLRNDLFLRAANKAENFYKQHWVFENDSQYWNEDTLESFFQAFLMAKLGPDCFAVKNVKPFELYWEYSKALTAKQDIEYEFKQLKNYAKSYKEMNDPDTGIYLLQFHEELDLIFDNLNLTSLHPFMLFIKHETGLSNIDLTQTFNMLESYIVRGLLSHGVNENKHICRRINLFFSNLISAKQGNFNVENREINLFFSNLISAKQGNFNVEEFANFLFYSGKPGDGARWLHDGAVVNGLRRVGDQIRAGNFTEILTLNMLGYILYRIEQWKIEQWNQENPSEPAKKIGFDLQNFLIRIKDDGSRGTIENDMSLPVRLLIPRSKHYKLKDLYNIGNLVFCTEHLTGPLSFRDKKDILSQGINADIMLNQEICRNYQQINNWGVSQITERERNLLRCFGKIWPPPEHFTGGNSETKVEAKTTREQISKSKAKPIVEPKWVSMLQSDNYQPTVFVTYTKSVELSKIEQSVDAAIGVDRSNEKQTLEKSNILFGCSSASWPVVEPYIETLHSVRRERLEGPPHTREERLNIPDRLLKSAQNRQITVFPVTRYGHQLEGTIEDFDKDAIYMQIRECLVIVYRHGLYEFAMGQWYQGVVTKFDEDKGFGYIRSNSFGQSIFLHIKEVRDRSVRTLQPNQRIEFELNRTTKGNGLSAINVELIEE